MEKQKQLLILAQQVQAIAETGLHYAEIDYDRDRYHNLESISQRLLALLTDLDEKEIRQLTPEHNGYRTPKVDARAVVFNEQDEILMVRERLDSRWSLPGGWCDIGHTPAEVAVKECYEEAGIHSQAQRLLAVWDKKCHKHPPDIHYSYKVMIECRALDQNIKPGMETLDVGWFPLDGLPELSSPRNTREQIETLFAFREGKHTWPLLD